MKRYCLRPDIKESIKDIIKLIGAFYLFFAVITAILQPITGHAQLYKEASLVIALTVSGRLLIGVGIYMVIKHTIKNYKLWFVEC